MGSSSSKGGRAYPKTMPTNVSSNTPSSLHSSKPAEKVLRTVEIIPDEASVKVEDTPDLDLIKGINEATKGLHEETIVEQRVSMNQIKAPLPKRKGKVEEEKDPDMDAAKRIILSVEKGQSTDGEILLLKKYYTLVRPEEKID